MAETRPSRILDISGHTENDNEQQYVEVGSNIYLGTKDGMKYTLMKTSDSKFRLVEALSDSNMRLNSSEESLPTPVKYDKSDESHVNRTGAESGSKLIKLMALKSEPLLCKGQGDEIGNSVISPTDSISSFKETDNSLEYANQEGTAVKQDISSVLTYTTLLPRQGKKESLNSTYYVTPEDPYCNYSSPFTPPISIRPTRYSRRGRTPGGSAYSSRGRGSGSRMRRPRHAVYRYNPQILHSTPTTFSSLNYNDVSSDYTSENSSRSSTDSFNKSDPSINYPRVPNNTPTSSEVDSAGNQKVFSLQWMPHIASRVENYISLDPRETHNEKERKRRLRIKNACQCMRELVPFMTDKIDNATVFEQAVYFIAFMREMVGNKYDTEFLEENAIF